MKILLISGSVKPDGATERAVMEAVGVLERHGLKYDVFNLYSEAIATCNGCGVCRKTGSCIHNDAATRLANICADFDGYIFFTPVHYGGSTGAIKAAMSRLFYSKKKHLEYKPAAAIAVARRAGCVSAIEELTRFFYFASMPIATGIYPGVIYGGTRDAADKDEEGLAAVRSITENFVWLIRCIDMGRLHGINPT